MVAQRCGQTTAVREAHRGETYEIWRSGSRKCCKSARTERDQLSGRKSAAIQAVFPQTPKGKKWQHHPAWEVLTSKTGAIHRARPTLTRPAAIGRWRMLGWATPAALLARCLPRTGRETVELQTPAGFWFTAGTAGCQPGRTVHASIAGYIRPWARYSMVAAVSRRASLLRSVALREGSAASGYTWRPWWVKAWAARGSCQGSVIRSTGAPGWFFWSQAAVRVAFSQVVQAQASPATSSGFPCGINKDDGGGSRSIRASEGAASAWELQAVASWINP